MRTHASGWVGVCLLSVAVVFAGCGRFQEESEDSNEGQTRRSEKLEKKLDKKEKALKETKQELAETKERLEESREGSTQTATKIVRLQKELADLKERKSRIAKSLAETEEDAAAKRRKITDLEDKISSKAESLEKARSRLQSQNKELANLTKKVNGLQEELKNTRQDLVELKEENKDRKRFVDAVLSPVQGLWKVTLSPKLDGEAACSLVYRIHGVNYEKAVICGPREESVKLPGTYEAGRFTDVVKVPKAEENEDSLSVHRRVFAKATRASCGADGFAAHTKAAAWTKGADQYLSVKATSEVSLEGLYTGSADRDTKTCEQVLSRPQRPGLERLVHACRLFQTSAEDLRQRQDLGCLARDGETLSWERAKIRAID